jgi:hypothetical protein
MHNSSTMSKVRLTTAAHVGTAADLKDVVNEVIVVVPVTRVSAAAVGVIHCLKHSMSMAMA